MQYVFYKKQDEILVEVCQRNFNSIEDAKNFRDGIQVIHGNEISIGVTSETLPSAPPKPVEPVKFVKPVDFEPKKTYYDDLEQAIFGKPKEELVSEMCSGVVAYKDNHRNYVLVIKDLRLNSDKMVDNIGIPQKVLTQRWQEVMKGNLDISRVCYPLQRINAEVRYFGEKIIPRLVNIDKTPAFRAGIHLYFRVNNMYIHTSDFNAAGISKTQIRNAIKEKKMHLVLLTYGELNIRSAKQFDEEWIFYVGEAILGNLTKWRDAAALVDANLVEVTTKRHGNILFAKFEGEMLTLGEIYQRTSMTRAEIYSKYFTTEMILNENEVILEEKGEEDEELIEVIEEVESTIGKFIMVSGNDSNNNPEAMEISEWADHFNIHPDIILDRWTSGQYESVTQAITTKVPVCRPDAFMTYMSRTQTIETWAKEYKLNPCVLSHRVFELKWPSLRSLATRSKYSD